MGVGQESCDGVIGHEGRDLRWRLGTLGAEPVGGPIERTEKGARGDDRVGGVERPAPNALADERAHAALVPIAFADDQRPEAGGQGIHLEMSGGPLDLVEQAQEVGDRKIAQPARQRPAVAPSGGQGGQQTLERPVLAEKQQLVLAPEVVIQIARREVRGECDLAHAGGREPARAKEPRRGLEDLDAPGVGAS
jgi:hypothetical protein